MEKEELKKAEKGLVKVAMITSISIAVLVIGLLLFLFVFSVLFTLKYFS